MVHVPLSLLMLAAPLVRGSLITAEIPAGFEQVQGTDVDAKQAVELGGVMVREKHPRKGLAAAALGASPMAGLPVDPGAPEICNRASAGLAQQLHAKLEKVEPLAIGEASVCHADFSISGAKYISQTYTWLLSPAERLGVQVVCSHLPEDTTATQRCLGFVKSVKRASKDK